MGVKDGIPHVQPPVALLKRMITARIHLDPTGADNGALSIVPGSHRHGRITSERIAAASSILNTHPRMLLTRASPGTK